jgi:Cys-tRNA(Pro)/Cys-tRNA(Cys) deacylase
VSSREPPEDYRPATMEQPTTPATEAVAAAGVAHEVVVRERSRSAEEAAGKLDIPLSNLLRTIVVRRAADDYLLVLVPGGRSMVWKRLRDHLGVSRISLPDADRALEVTGYERGTITPFGALGSWPVLADASIPGSGRVSVGGGAHGVAILLDADDLLAAVDAEVVDVADPD